MAHIRILLRPRPFIYVSFMYWTHTQKLNWQMFFSGYCMCIDHCFFHYFRVTTGLNYLWSAFLELKTRCFPSAQSLGSNKGPELTFTVCLPLILKCRRWIIVWKMRRTVPTLHNVTVTSPKQIRWPSITPEPWTQSKRTTTDLLLISLSQRCHIIYTTV